MVNAKLVMEDTFFKMELVLSTLTLSMEILILSVKLGKEKNA